jgi:hypothetical protein
MAVRLYRVFNYLASAHPDQPGGAFFIPRQGAGRLDNPTHYSILYASTEPEAAVAESLGPQPSLTWATSILRGHPQLPGSVRALATYEVSDLSGVCDLDDPIQLASNGLRPSRVITRDYEITQSWALRLFQRSGSHRWNGVRWWSWYEGLWSNIGIWRRDRMRLRAVTVLDLSNPAVVGAARAIGRQIVL